eukprot:GEMP01003135.1.p1 GENE.GEMP01003135.1~~GEMP01003135.1.p1  ORF type:complete len:1353 (+),score=324.17 GEMP01003135.1:71-4129(+)
MEDGGVACERNMEDGDVACEHNGSPQECGGEEEQNACEEGKQDGASKVELPETEERLCRLHENNGDEQQDKSSRDWVENCARVYLTQLTKASIARAVGIFAWGGLVQRLHDYQEGKISILKNRVFLEVAICQNPGVIEEIRRQVPAMRWKWWAGECGLTRSVLQRGEISKDTTRSRILYALNPAAEKLDVLLPKSLMEKFSFVKAFDDYEIMSIDAINPFSGPTKPQRTILDKDWPKRMKHERLQRARSEQLYQLIQDTYANQKEFPMDQIIELLMPSDQLAAADLDYRPDVTHYGWYMIHFVCASVPARKTCLELLQAMQLCNLDATKVDSQQNTPLHVAALRANIPAITFLMKHTPVELEACNADGSSAFLLAAAASNVSAAREILRNTCDFDFFDVLEGSDADDERGRHQREANNKMFHLVREGHHCRTQEMLANNEAEREACDSNGYRAIHVAAIVGDGDNLVDMIDVLADEQCDLNARIPIDSKDVARRSLTALHICAVRRQDGALKRLLERRANPSMETHTHHTALMLLGLNDWTAQHSSTTASVFSPPNILLFYYECGRSLPTKNLFPWKRIQEEVLDWVGGHLTEKPMSNAESTSRNKQLIEGMKKAHMLLKERVKDNATNFITDFYVHDLVRRRAELFIKKAFGDQPILVKPEVERHGGKYVIGNRDRVQVFLYCTHGDFAPNSSEAKRRSENRKQLWDALVHPLILMAQCHKLSNRLRDFLHYLLVSLGGSTGLCVGVMLGADLQCPPVRTWNEVEAGVRSTEQNKIDNSVAFDLDTICSNFMTLGFRKYGCLKKTQWVGYGWFRGAYPRDRNWVDLNCFEHVNHDRFRASIPLTLDESRSNPSHSIAYAVARGHDRLQLKNHLFFAEHDFTCAPSHARLNLIIDSLIFPICSYLMKALADSEEFHRLLPMAQYCVQQCGGGSFLRSHVKLQWYRMQQHAMTECERISRASIDPKGRCATYTTDFTEVPPMDFATIENWVKEPDALQRIKESRMTQTAHGSGASGTRSLLSFRRQTTEARTSDETPFLGQDDVTDIRPFVNESSMQNSKNGKKSYYARSSIRAYIQIRASSGCTSLTDFSDLLRFTCPSPMRGVHFWRMAYAMFLHGVAQRAADMIDLEMRTRFPKHWLGVSPVRPRSVFFDQMAGGTEAPQFLPEDHEALAAYHAWVTETDAHKKAQRLNMLGHFTRAHVRACGWMQDLVHGTMRAGTEQELLELVGVVRYPLRAGTETSCVRGVVFIRNGFHPQNSELRLRALSRKLRLVLQVDGVPVAAPLDREYTFGFCHLVSVDFVLDLTRRCEDLCDLAGLLSEPRSENFPEPEIRSYPTAGRHDVPWPASWNTEG